MHIYRPAYIYKYRLSPYIFPILQRFGATLCNFSNFKMFFLAMETGFTKSRLTLFEEWSIITVKIYFY